MLKIKKRAQVEFSPIILVAVLIGLLIFAPIMMRVIGVTTGTFFKQMNSTAPSAVNEASQAVDKVYNFFDYLIVIAMFINIIVLFISAWFIDTNPVFIVLYVMFAFILVLFLPNMLDGVDQIWGKMDSIASSDTWGDNGLHLDLTNWIRNHFVEFMVAIIMLSGIITYAKIKILSGGGY